MSLRKKLGSELSETQKLLNLDMPELDQASQFHKHLEDTPPSKVTNKDLILGDRALCFVQTIKKLTFVQEINIYNSDLCPIFKDFESQEKIKCSVFDRLSIVQKLEQFDQMEKKKPVDQNTK